jgi:hypothetical protein
LKNVIKSKPFRIVIVSVLILSVIFNIHLTRVVYDLVNMNGNTPEYIYFDNANSRDSIFTFHNVKKAHETATGEGIKVGILDNAFGVNELSLYSNMVDFLNNGSMEIKGHGCDMARVLREVSPGCAIYALNCMAYDNTDIQEKTVIKAINWAIENEIDILSYSSDIISDANRGAFDDAVSLAHENNIITTFIHYPGESNILPNGFLPSNADYVGRTEDLNVFNYDYNSVELNSFRKYQEAVQSSGELESVPFLSVSATAPATAGFVAVLKSVNNSLTPEEYKEILIDTSYSYLYHGNYDFDKQIQCPRVVDLLKAVEYIEESY